MYVAYVSGTDDHSSLCQVTDGLFIDMHCRIGANQLHIIMIEEMNNKKLGNVNPGPKIEAQEE